MTRVALTNGMRFDQIGDGPYLRYRFTMLYPKGEGPKNARGTLRQEAPPGAKFDKLHLFPVGVRFDDSGESDWMAGYSVPESVRNAPFGELVLNRREECEECHVYFGRFGEKEKHAFTFNTAEDEYYIFLRIYRSEEVEFNPLYIRAEVGEEVKYFVLIVEWRNDIIVVGVLPTDEENVPDFLGSEFTLSKVRF